MILPQTQLQCLILAVLGMMCLAGWASLYKFTRNWRFELFYFDLTLGFCIAALVYAYTTGSLGFDGLAVMDDLGNAWKRRIGFALAAGLALNLANILLLGAVSVGGIAVSFILCIGLGMLLGVGVPLLLGDSPRIAAGSGILLILVSLALMAAAYHGRVGQRHTEAMTANAKPIRRPSAVKGLLLSLFAGFALAPCFPLMAAASIPEIGVGPYSAILLIAVAVAGSTLVFNLVLMNLPIQGEPVEIVEWFKGKWRNHALGLLGGAIWCSGLLAMLIVSSPSAEVRLDTRWYGLISWSVPLVAAALGIAAWSEFRGSSGRVRAYLLLMFLLFGGGIALLSLAPAAPVS